MSLRKMISEVFEAIEIVLKHEEDILTILMIQAVKLITGLVNDLSRNMISKT